MHIVLISIGRTIAEYVIVAYKNVIHAKIFLAMSPMRNETIDCDGSRAVARRTYLKTRGES